jgi:hypothetical protein
VNPPGHRSG